MPGMGIYMRHGHMPMLHGGACDYITDVVIVIITALRCICQCRMEVRMCKPGPVPMVTRVAPPYTAEEAASADRPLVTLLIVTQPSS